MKGKTKGSKNNKNKSIKKNQIPAFMLTGGDLDNYNNYVNDRQKDYKGAMNYAVEQVKDKMKNCTDENKILQDIANKEKLNKDNLIIKLNELQRNMSNLEISANEVKDLQTQMTKCNEEKGALQTQIYELNSQNEQLTKTNDDITRISEELKTAQELAAKEASDAKELADNEAIAAQELAESKKLSTENEAKPYATDFMGTIISKASEKPILIGELEKKIKLFEEEKIVLDAQIVENKQTVDNLTKEYNELKKQYETLQVEHETCTKNLKQLKDEHEATFNKLLQLVQNTNLDNLSEDTKNELGDKDKQITDIINAINGKLTGVKKQQEDQHNVETNTKIEEVKKDCQQKIAEMKTGKSNELGDITNQIDTGKQELASILEDKENAEGIIKQSEQAAQTLSTAQNQLNNIKSEAEQAQKTINDAVAAKEEAVAAQSEAVAAKANVENVNKECEEKLAAAELEK